MVECTDLQLKMYIANIIVPDIDIVNIVIKCHTTDSRHACIAHVV